MQKYRTFRLLPLLVLLVFLSGCFLQPSAQPSTQPSAQPSVQPGVQEIEEVLAARMDGVNRADQQEYLSTVLPGDAVLLREETNLIRSAAGLGIKDYKLTAGETQKTADGFTAALTQSYTTGGTAHQCAYDALFVRRDGKLYFDGPAFLRKENSRVKVYYTQGDDEMAAQTLEAETAVLEDMEENLGYAPKDVIAVKIYGDQQVFLQSVKLDLPAWVGGWQEYGEAIKSFAGAYPASTGDLREMLNHETTHRMVSELSNDNASYWIQEGLAEVFRATLGEPKEPLLSPEEAAREFTPYAQQKDINLEALDMSDGAAIVQYYATSKALAAFLLDKYGWDKMRQALEYLKRYPLNPVTGAEKIPENNAMTEEAIRSVYSFATDGDFQNAFDEWLKGIKQAT